MALDQSDIVNAVEEQVLTTLQGFASLDADWENPVFVKGFPRIDRDTPLARPVVAVYTQDGQFDDTGFDNIVDTNAKYLTDPDYEFTRGVSYRADLYIDCYTSAGTSENPVASGGETVAKRIAGKIGARLRLNSECLGAELDLTRTIRVSGPFERADSNRPDVLFYRVETGIETVVTEVLTPQVLAY